MTIAQISRSLSAGSQSAADSAAEHIADAEVNRHLAGDVVEALVASGFARHFVPARWSGNAGSFAELADASATVGAECLSAGWCGLIFATSSRMAALLPLAGQEELWSEHPDALIAAGLVPGGTAVPTPGGWLLSGTWRPLSGVDFADWTLLCAPIADQQPQQLHFFAVPRRDFLIRDTWDTVGMRGTGSKTVVVDEAFVPSDRAFAQQVLLRGSDDPTAANCHRAPLLAVAPPLFVSPALGAARGALASWSRTIAEGTTPAGPASGVEFNQRTLAETSAEIDAAELLLQRALDVADSGQFSPLLAARNARDASHSAGILTGAVDRLFRAAGAPAQQSGAVLQRVWRDIHCATTHAALRPDRAAQHHARAVWG